MSDFAEHSTMARQALARAESKALLREYQDALVLADAAVREAKAFRIALIGKAHGNNPHKQA